MSTILRIQVRIEEEFLARIFLSETDLMIAGAFVDCENTEKALVDTVTYKVSGCKHGLIGKDDTIVIAFKPTSSGLKKVFGNNNSDKG